MPTIVRLGPYRFFFYSADGREPAHIHIERDDSVCKFWLDPVRPADGGGFGRVELRELGRLVHANRNALLEGWNGYFRT